MNVVMFYHSLLSDWNHGNAHFLRGIATELIMRGHTVTVYEPVDAWSLKSLLAEHGTNPVDEFHKTYPLLSSIRYDLNTLDLDTTLEQADLVIVHEWNAHKLVALIGEHHANNNNYVLLFHDTHHRSVTDSQSMAGYDLKHYDGVLAFGNVIRELYLLNHWTKRAWTWHEAADTRIFYPQMPASKLGDLVWIGNWGDGERADELGEFLLKPVQDLGLKARVYGVRYPPHAIKALATAGIEYCGWLPNYKAPAIFSRFKLTVHVPRKPYVMALPGIPTIRPFEALACGIPLISAPWSDCEGLFSTPEDFLFAYSGEEMKQHMRRLLDSPQEAHDLAVHGRATILKRHTVANRVEELLKIYSELTPALTHKKKGMAA